MKKLLINSMAGLFLVTYSCIGFAEEEILILEPEVQAHEGIDALYQEFARAYGELDADVFKTIYAEDTYYLAPQSPMIFGNDEVAEKGFAEWFEYVRQGNGSLSVVFTIIDREVASDLAYDVGYIKSTQKLSGQEDEIYEFKILVVSQKQDDGQWRFQADTYSALK